jgi:hypothetical protein
MVYPFWKPNIFVIQKQKGKSPTADLKVLIFTVMVPGGLLLLM